MKKNLPFVLIATSIVILTTLIGSGLVVRKTLATAKASVSHPPPIVSISVCSPDSLGGTRQQGSCADGTFDTHQIVLAPDGRGDPVNAYNAAGSSDEHSSAFSPGTLGNNPDYLFFVASGTVGHDGIGAVVLSGGTGPDANGQWTFHTREGYGSFTNSAGQADYGQVFKAPFMERDCPTVDSGNAIHQDQTFDLNYAAPGSVVKDRTGPAGSLLMIYEGTNACVGGLGGPKPGAGPDSDDAYMTTGVATSTDYGKTWPTYRHRGKFRFVPVPDSSQTYGPKSPSGALWPDVCVRNNCNPTPSPTPLPGYGRYPVLSPHTSLATLMATGQSINGAMGDSAPSAFVDDVGPDQYPYLYAVYDYRPGPPQDPPILNRSSDIRIAQAQLNGGMAPLSFNKFYQPSPSSTPTFVPNSGIGGLDSAVLPDGDFANCGKTSQNRTHASISYVEATQQYVLLFLCNSPRDPKTGTGGQGAAWFYATSYDPKDPSQWSQPDPLGHAQPQEIDGSWSPFDPAYPSCNSYKGWYPSPMSLGSEPGHLSTSGYVFYLWGCATGDPNAPPRQFSSRAFKITTTDTTPPMTSAVFHGHPGQNGWYTGSVTIDFSATDDLSGVARTEYSLDDGTTWTAAGTSITLRASAEYNILYRSIDLDGNVEAAKPLAFKLDSRPPATLVNTRVHTLGGVPIDLEIDLTVTDDLSGVAETEYRVDQSTTWRTGNILFLCGGNHTVHYFSTDVAGNTERRKSTAISAPACGGP
jgi:hypothetical protein